MLNSDDVYKHLVAISRISSTNKKKEMLRYKILEPYLFYAYNPHYQFGIKKVTPIGIGDKHFDKWAWRLLDVLRTRKLTGNKAKRAMLGVMRELTPRSSTLLCWILTKDLRCGIGPKLINSIFPNLIPHFEVMLAEDYDPKRAKLPCFISPKLDGLRAIWKYPKFYTRSGREHRGLEILKHVLSKFDKTVELDGELIIPGSHFQDISGQVRSITQSAAIEYHVFDTPNIKMPFSVRYDYLKHTLTDFYPNVYVVEHQKVSSHSRINMLYKKYKSAGYEGAMVKTWDHLYRDGRNYDWMKIVDEIKQDLPCVGLYKGEGKYSDSLGGIFVRMPNGRTTKVGSGFSDNQREVYYNQPRKIIGRTCEILFKERTKSGRLRHPRFGRVRTDK